MATAIFPLNVAPAPLEAIPKLWAMAAPTNIPIMAIEESAFPSPDNINCRKGQPPKRMDFYSTINIPKKFQSPSV